MSRKWLPDLGVETAGELLDLAKVSAMNAISAGPAHRQRLDSIDTRIVVSGVRGKSSATRWLHDVFHRRGSDTFAKITGDEPFTLHNGNKRKITRSEQVRLYENEREIRRATGADIAIVENQGIRQYTTRLVNEAFVRPDVIFLINVREDHMDTMGRNRTAIARSLSRAVSEKTTVIVGESNPALRSYLTAELERRNATVKYADPPDWAVEYPGSEVVFGLNKVLKALDEPPLPASKVDRKLSTMMPEWQVLPDGRIYDAAAVNDVQSTEIVRRALIGNSDTVIEPLVNLRSDRRGRTASFRRYLASLVTDGYVEQVHTLGDDQYVFANTADFSVQKHDDTMPPSTLLEELFSASNPVFLMGNTVTDTMRKLQAEIENQTTGRIPAAITQQGRRDFDGD
ncbi:Mur ligase (plasmid) [Haloarcula hispanica N601]|uniref:Mur ligase n=2 Tax=Haloarcula hispanica TaxID=51589 RepID=V5TS35_HALHI|nr:Mur ligase family protein [Haloarcula hispanica]AEM58826.1 Mur ligase family CapB protein [Haloarcula hispanica ATCC 33960]AHB67958.1 Mur ligase [Haloarcula hispanica N601]